MDWLAGFGAFCAALGTVVVRQDLRPFLLVVAVAYFVVAALRSGSRFEIGRTLLVASGGVVTILLLRVTRAAFTAPVYVPLFVATAIAASLAGAWFGSLFRRRNLARAGVVAAAAALATFFLAMVAGPRLMHSVSAQTVQRPAPDFAVTTLDGLPLRSRDLRGRVVVIAFWATWCTPCREELPEVEGVYQRFRTDPRVAFLVLDVADSDTVDQARAFLTKARLTMPAAMDSTGTPGSKGSAAQSLGQQTLPQIYLLDATGQVRWVHTGYDGSEELAGHLADAITSAMAQK
jgi:thiol-disulfide isomerase/thioredoxin